MSQKLVLPSFVVLVTPVLLVVYNQRGEEVHKSPLPQGLIQHMEVQNTADFEGLIASVCTGLKEVAAEVVIVLAETFYFVRDITSLSVEEVAATEQNFSDMTPFERVLTKWYEYNKQKWLISVNQDLCEAFMVAFQRNHFMVLGVLPVLGLGVATTEQGLEKSAVKSVIDKRNKLKELSLIPGQLTTAAFTTQSRNYIREHVGFVLLVTVLLLLIAFVVIWIIAQRVLRV